MKIPKDTILWILLLVVLIVLDSQILFLDFKLNLSILLVCYISYKRKPYESLLWAVCIGIILDSISSTLIGPNILSKGSVVLLSSFVRSRFYLWPPLFNIIFGFIITVIDGILGFLSLILFYTQPTEFIHAIYIVFFQAIINGIIFYFVKI